ncbi:MAG: NADH-quinone oxidoreductase subunit J [Armatimonadetes bacterium]|jgi:NADH-quinone oxidoreductase subunit J|nr:NADH-quinone oxidoreductase subunit J [Armatimonadota bacterium]
MPPTTTQDIIFLALAFVTLASGIAVVLLRNLVHAGLMLGLSFFGVAGLYLLLHAEFLAVAQVLIYVGAITVLILFAIMLTRQVVGADTAPVSTQRLVGFATALAVFLVLVRFMYRREWPGIFDNTEVLNAPTVLGRQLLTTYLIPFEVASILLLVALVVAIVLAKEETVVSLTPKLNTIYEETDSPAKEEEK